MSARLLKSPWLEQLNPRISSKLNSDLHTQLAVVGAGIAGVATTYFLLTKTWKTVALIEADKIAHGATGHNAGQLASYFERPFADIVSEFGPELAAQGQRDVESAWQLLEDIRHDLKLKTPYLAFKGYAGCKDLTELVIHLRNSETRDQAGIKPEPVLVSKTFAHKDRIPRGLRKYYQLASQAEISDLLQTSDHRYFAALESKKGVMNSALFCEEIMTVLRTRYPFRLQVFEKTPVNKVKLYANKAELVCGKHTVHAKRVILCTNGFEKLNIENHAGSDIDVKFHHLVKGSIGYMAAFTEKPAMAPAAVSYLPSHENKSASAYDSAPYFYLTRRPYGEETNRNLVCIGGPEALLDNTNNYNREHPYPLEAKKLIDKFVQQTYKRGGRQLKYTHLWHGLMGYTPNGIRCVGAEPCNPVLMYNLGCNGIGILPSIFGGFRISQLIKYKRLRPSIFDPADVRCIVPQRKTAEDIIGTPAWLSRNWLWGFTAVWALATIIMLAAYWS